MAADTKRIAMERVEKLFNLALETFHEDKDLAQRYVATARKIAMAAKIRLPKQYRHLVCRHCKSFIVPGANCRVRIKQRREPHVMIECMDCGKHTRIPMKNREAK